VLPAPELVEAQAIEMDGEANVALELKRGTLTERVVRGEEAAESHALWDHGRYSFLGGFGHRVSQMGMGGRSQEMGAQMGTEVGVRSQLNVSAGGYRAYGQLSTVNQGQLAAKRRVS